MKLPDGFRFFVVSPGPTLQYTLVSPAHAIVLPPQQGAVMLVLLANYSRPVSRETVLATMYPDKRPPNAIGVMKVCMMRIREMLEEYGITFDLYSDQIPRPDLGPSVTMTNLRQQPQDKPKVRGKGMLQSVPRLAPSPPKRGAVRPVVDTPWTFPNRIEARNRRKAP